MNLSHYSVIIKDTEDPDSIILYSIKKESLIRINQDTLEMIQTGDLPEEAEKQLADLEFIVLDQVSEKEEMLGYIGDFNQNFRGLDITVTLNLDCNFACIYCCEEGIKNQLELMRQGFDLVEKRFEQVDKRFEDMQNYMDKRFSALQWMMGIGFTLLAALMGIFNFF